MGTELQLRKSKPASTKPLKAEIVYELKGSVSRGADGAPCKCGGYADSVSVTPGENKAYGCGRSWVCCAVAFKCRVCGARNVGRQAAPEMD